MKKLSRKALALFGCIAFTALLLNSCKKPTDAGADTQLPAYTVTAPEGLESTVTIDETAKTITLAPTAEDQEYKISGEFEGQIINKTKGTVIILSNAKLKNTQGKAAIFGELKTEIKAEKDTVNTITVTGEADEAYGAGAVQCGIKGDWKKIEIGGSGSCTITCENAHGVKAGDVELKGSGTFVFDGGDDSSAINCNVFTVAEEKTFTATFKDSKNGIKADKTITIASGTFKFENIKKAAMKTDTSKDDKDGVIDHYIHLDGGSFTFTNCEGKKTDTEKNCFVKAASVVGEF